MIFLPAIQVIAVYSYTEMTITGYCRNIAVKLALRTGTQL